jgi:putative membrane protein
MQPGTKFLRFLKSWAINTLAVAMTVLILRGHISYEDKPQNLLLASLLLGILNAFVRPILMLIALPLLIFTLGLFMLVINALLLALLTVLLPFFHITRDGVNFSFGYAFLGALLIGAFSIALNILTGNARASIKIQRRPPPPKKPDDDDDKPVIDV